jgi:hypothetical protein
MLARPSRVAVTQDSLHDFRRYAERQPYHSRRNVIEIQREAFALAWEQPRAVSVLLHLSVD